MYDHDVTVQLNCICFTIPDSKTLVASLAPVFVIGLCQWSLVNWTYCTYSKMRVLVLLFALVALLGLGESISSPASSFAPFRKVGSADEEESDASSIFGSKKRNPEREQLYEAYNLLHTLAQVS